ncbi:hypothetical protein [Chryseobacterium oncorhynchi]|uniref:Uncharacterized protein n=1 Tax=Chryseobacterium oncorhynchi TaxID=741074 RepID=A0A316X8I2_9FLAO|nr:hypothetical protein [Chryseobacterium oncorhynchi]PWN67628.1 hypothetical protein C1638_003285 [Chryseobacterium oncorhynchi]
MNQYLVYVNCNSQPKNTLEKELIKFLGKIDRTIIDKKDLQSFKENIASQIGFISQEIESNSTGIVWYSRGEKNKDFGLKGLDFAIVRIYEIKRKYEITKPE